MRPTPAKTLGLTTVAMFAFAANSLLCRVALKSTAIDAASFTSIRLVAGAFTLCLLVRRSAAPAVAAGDWTSASALATYAACFSWAYVGLPAATGALLLFAAVQTTMIGSGIWRGERLTFVQTAGLLAAGAGLLGLLLPGARAPRWDRAALMVAAGIAWGVYSLRGRGSPHPLAATAGNFWRAGVVSLGLSLVLHAQFSIDRSGAGYAIASGALASGLGYAIWYRALRGLRATVAAAVQLSVPVLAAFGAVVWLDEPFDRRLALAAVVILGGVATVVAAPRRVAADDD